MAIINENDVWFDGFIKWNGYEYSVHTNNFPLEPNGDGWRIYGMWGTLSSDFYIVGEHGNIAHYNGESWEKIESGTEVRLLDVYGNSNSSKVYACGYTDGLETTALLEINMKNNKVTKLYEGGSDGIISGMIFNLYGGVYSYGMKTYLMNGGMIYELLNEEPLEIKLINRWAIWWGESISGESYNDIIVSGQQGMLLHYNGIDSKEYGEFENYNLFLYGSAIKNGTVVVCGMQYEGGAADSPAIIIVGKR